MLAKKLEQNPNQNPDPIPNLNSNPVQNTCHYVT